MPNTTPAGPPDRWAEVRAHDQVMRYRRSGMGPAVLLLAPSTAAGALWPELAGALAGRFRLIAPEAPPTDAGCAAWLADFLEGLGLTSAAILAAGGYCLAAIELVLLDADRVSRAVLVPGVGVGGQSPGSESGVGVGTLTPHPPTAAVPLLVVRRGLAADEALPLVTRFLAGEPAHPG